MAHTWLIYYKPVIHVPRVAMADTHARTHARRISKIGEHLTNTHTHTHTFNGPFSGTTRVGQYQKGKTNLDFTEARDSEWHLAPDR